jgi:hypothetical protein
MTKPKANHTIRRIVAVHPPEADAVAAAFGEVRRAAERELEILQSTAAELDAGWEGRQKDRYREELRTILDRIRDAVIPQLSAAEKKYRIYTMEKTVEETVSE